jgi:hypothetical protein
LDICHKKNPQTLVLWVCGFKVKQQFQFKEEFKCLKIIFQNFPYYLLFYIGLAFENKTELPKKTKNQAI